MTVSDEVTIDIENREPGIAITDRPSGDSVEEGARVTVRSRADDRSCTTGHGTNAADQREIDWYVNGSHVASGATLMHSVNVGPGSALDIQAEYTDEAGATATTEVLTYDVVEAPDGPRPPNVTIVHPPDGETLYRSCGELRLEADAEDPDGGTIDAYDWVVTDQNGFSKSYQGNDIEIQFWTCSEPIFEPGDFHIEVTVTDDEDQRSSTSIDVRVIPGL
ncbi:MAG: hypothetical protein U5J97_10530 [Trueperaceae bacterium]|nr:hypothetical protein [Trueperaceae bacterium]